MSQADDKPTVRVTTEAESPVLCKLGVEVDASRVAKAFDRAYRELQRQSRVRGFRPGKAPRSVLEKLHGAAVLEDIERILVSETLPEAVGEAGVTPVAEPSIDATPPAADAPFRYTARVEVKPELELPDLEGLEATRPSVDVSEAEVERELESLRERRASLVDEPAGTVAARGHTLTIDYVGRIEGEPFEGGSAQGAVVEMGSGRFVPGFEEQLEGAQVDEDRELQVRFPEDYGAAELAGKEAIFAIHVHAIQRRELPELDDAFAKELGEFESLAELQERIRSDLESGRGREADAALRRGLMDWILERMDFPVPPGLVDRHLEQRLAAAHRQLAQALPEDELHARIGEWREQWRPDAEREVREELVLEAAARAQGLEADDEELEARIQRMARDQGMDPARLRKAYQERGLEAALRADLVAEKALAFLRDEAKIIETPGT